MDRPREGHTERSKSDREREILSSILYVWNVKEMIQMNWSIKEEQMHKEKKMLILYFTFSNSPKIVGDFLFKFSGKQRYKGNLGHSID